MADFVFGDFSEQEKEKFFGHDKQSIKINEPEFPWSTDDCISTTIEFGFNVPSVISPRGCDNGISYPNYNSCNESSSHKESTNSALTSPPYSSKSSSIENLKIIKKQSSSSSPHNDRKLKKKRPPGYYKQEYQQMLEQLNGQQTDETTPTIQIDSNEQTPQQQNLTETNFLLLSSNDSKCHQWVKSTMEHQQLDDDDDQSSKQSLNNDEIDSDRIETTTDTDNDNDLYQSSSTTRPTYPLNILQSNDQQLELKSNQNLIQTSNQIINDLNIYSTSVTSGTSIETLKPSNNNNLSSSSSSSPIKQNDLFKSKPSTWADLFRNNQTSTNIQSSHVQQIQTTTTTSPIKKSQPSIITPQQNGNNNPIQKSNFHSKTNYHVYNSNGGESKSLEDYFSKCEVRPSAMAIKPRGLLNKNNYSYVNATLQALLACPSFFNVMKYIPLNEDPIDHVVPCIKAIHLFVNQFEKMDRSKSNATNHKDIICGQPFDPINILEEISRLRHQSIDITKTKSDDAHDLLCQLLNEIHDEICSILYNKTTSENDSLINNEQSIIISNENGEETTTTKTEDWLQVGKRNRAHILQTNEIRKSLITDIFAGQFRSTIHISGNQKSIIHEQFFTLSIDIKDPKITTLDEALIRFSEQSILSDYMDTKTRQNIHTNKTMLIEQLPPILIIHLKYLLSDESDGIKKLSYTVNLTLPKNILTEQARKHSFDRYKLFAVEYNFNEHYLTDVFNPGLQGWVRYNDNNVHVVTSSQVMNCSFDKLTPYLLFYRRGD